MENEPNREKSGGNFCDVINDEELIRLYREGDGNIPGFLMEKYKGLVRQRARQLFLAGGDTDDLIQEGMIGLFEAIRSYCPDRQTSFSTFAVICIDRQLYHAIQKSNRLKNIPLNNYVPLPGDTPYMEDYTACDSNPETILIDREDRIGLEMRIRSVLSPMENKVLSRFMAGESYDEIGKALNKPVKSVDNAVQRIRRKIRAMG